MRARILVADDLDVGCGPCARAQPVAGAGTGVVDGVGAKVVEPDEIPDQDRVRRAGHGKEPTVGGERHRCRGAEGSGERVAESPGPRGVADVEHSYDLVIAAGDE